MADMVAGSSSDNQILVFHRPANLTNTLPPTPNSLIDIVYRVEYPCSKRQEMSTDLQGWGVYDISNFSFLQPDDSSCATGSNARKTLVQRLSVDAITC